MRRGAFKYVEGLPDPGGAGAQRGTRVHTRVEDYLQGRGAALDPSELEDAMALSLAAHIPAPGTPADLERRGVVIEGMISYHRGDLHYNGRKDLEWWDDFEKRDGLVVTDYKTTSQFKYALTREALVKNVQALTYADHSFHKHPDQNVVRLEWLYVLATKAAPVRPIVVEINREYVSGEMSRIDGGTRTIFAVREEGDEIKESGRSVREYVNSLPYDESLQTCAKYGKEGCPYKSECAAHGGGGIQSVKTAFRAMLGRKGNVTNMGMSVDLLRARMAAKKEGIETTNEMTAEEINALIAGPVAPPVQPEASGQPAPKFIPPTGRTFTAPPVSPGHNGVVPSPVGDAKPPFVLPEEVAAGAKALAAPDQETTPKAPAKPRGRPKSTPADTAESPRTETPPQTPGVTLLVNVLGLKIEREVILLSTFLAPVHAAIKEAHGLVHYSAADFGKGRAILTEALDQYLTAHPFSSQAIFVDSRTAEGADALPTLERHAGEIYRGV